MCYNSEISFTFATVGILTTAYIYAYKSNLTKTGIQYILIFYALMEFLQGFQYFFVNQCSNAVNVFLTEVAYILVIVQPLMWNSFFYFNSPEKDKVIFKVAIGLFAVWMALDVAARFMYGKTNRNKTKETQSLASDKVCTKKQKTHLYWEWTSADFGEYNANAMTYFMLWFMPALFSEKFRSTSIVIFVSALVAGLVAHASGEFFTFPSLWCYISVPIFMGIFFKYIFIDK